MALTLQDKLALMMTSAGSHRALASLVGVSHQKIGRWLRVGEPATVDPTTGYIIHGPGARIIPESARPLIDAAFALHKDVTRVQAREDGLPYNPSAPVFIARGIMRNGQKGDRVIALKTEYIRPELRNEFIARLQQSGRFYQASVRSIINVYSYAEKTARTDVKQRGRGIDPRIVADAIARKLLDDRSLEEGIEESPLYTRYENISPGVRTANALYGINRKLQEKHEPHAVKLADQYLFQVIPRKNEKTKTRRKPTSKNIKSRRQGKAPRA